MKTHEVDGFIMGVEEAPTPTFRHCARERLSLFEVQFLPGVSSYDMWRHAIQFAEDHNFEVRHIAEHTGENLDDFRLDLFVSSVGSLA